jgi:hypothetical protein
MWESKLSDADMQAVPRALARAAKRAREIARVANTPKDGLEQMPEVGTDEEFKRSDDRGRLVIL